VVLKLNSAEGLKAWLVSSPVDVKARKEPVRFEIEGGGEQPGAAG
jgi:hypothetical protein